MKASSKCIQLIRQFDGFKAEPFLSESGIPSIGFGSTKDLYGNEITLQHDNITIAEAVKLLRNTLVYYEDIINQLIRVKVNQNQIDALISLTYNIGEYNLRHSILLRLLNSRDYEGASKQFGKWITSNGHISNKYIKKREEERKLFLT